MMGTFSHMKDLIPNLKVFITEVCAYTFCNTKRSPFGWSDYTILHNIRWGFRECPCFFWSFLCIPVLMV
jgi:hypothetical protein